MGIGFREAFLLTVLSVPIFSTHFADAATPENTDNTLVADNQNDNREVGEFKAKRLMLLWATTLDDYHVGLEIGLRFTITNVLEKDVSHLVEMSGKDVREGSLSERAEEAVHYIAANLCESWVEIARFRDIEEEWARFPEFFKSVLQKYVDGGPWDGCKITITDVDALKMKTIEPPDPLLEDGHPGTEQYLEKVLGGRPPKDELILAH